LRVPNLVGNVVQRKSSVGNTAFSSDRIEKER